MPVCAPVDSTECAAYLGKKRQVLLFAHGYNGVEDATTAQQFLDMFGATRKTQNDTIFVYGVSKDGLRAWNADLCCTFESSAGVDDVTYLVNVSRDVATRTAINAARVGVFGWSNGGMLALKADCARPDVFDFGTSWAGTWVGPCGKSGVHVMQMHGSADTTVPVTGGRTYVADHWIDVPPAANLGAQLAKGNNFPLTVYSGQTHQPNATMIALQLTWAFANLKG
ncbi:hypothetical protein EPD65_15510 [Nocardioides jejuensis]|uniref:Peptidase S9 prolyl oligopeptidase catalytic domain-containing protein n=1 Tax=Nocardioides jejuensis TaxID=2502782 RepID=A0A4R1BTN5_9ACTN|nr:hypothetical protein EPD65_15510 [Nocardioides jejuensis]